MADRSELSSAQSRQPDPPDFKVLLIALVALGVACASVRLPFLFVRDPFFDELFTRWIAAKSPGEILWLLHFDSGPPLYYWLIHFWSAVAGDSITSLRVASFLFAVLTLGVVFASRASFEVRITASLLLVLWPTHVYFSTEARSYALCALFIGAAAVALERWVGERRPAFMAAGSAFIVLAAYTHYYGILATPLILALAIFSRERGLLARGTIATAIVAAAVAPVFILLAHQPEQAMQWALRYSAPTAALGILQQLQFAAPYPAAVMPAPATFLRLVAMVLLTPLVAFGTMRSSEVRRWLVTLVVPVAGLLFALLIGKRAWFPSRFESVLVVPFVLTVAASVVTLDRPLMRRAAVIGLAIIGAIVWGGSIGAFASRDSDPLRNAAMWTRARVGAPTTVVASGFAFLEVEAQRTSAWSPRVVAFPAEQAKHPGWLAMASPPVLEAESIRLRNEVGRFVWIGDLRSPEFASLKRTFALRLLYRDGSVAVLAASSRGS